MDFNKYRIGYVPLSSNFNLPGDRRRFCYYASKRGINFEIADPSKDYDIVVVTQKGDLSIWSKYRKGKTKVVYDFIDSYLAIPRYDLKGMFRGLAKFAAGESRCLKLNYWKAIENMRQRRLNLLRSNRAYAVRAGGYPFNHRKCPDEGFGFFPSEFLRSFLKVNRDKSFRGARQMSFKFSHFCSGYSLKSLLQK